MALIAAHRIQSPSLAMADTLAATDVSVTLERARATATGGFRLHFWAEGPDLDGFETNLAADDTVSSVLCLDDEPGERLYSARVDEEATLTAANEAFDATWLTVRYDDDWWFTESRFPGTGALERYRDWLSDHHADVRVDNVYVEDGRHEPALTRRQRETLVLAYEMGFYEVPRQATLADLAEEFDVSEQAISQRLRRGYSRLVARAYSD